MNSGGRPNSRPPEFAVRVPLRVDADGRGRAGLVLVPRRAGPGDRPALAADRLVQAVAARGRCRDADALLKTGIDGHHGAVVEADVRAGVAVERLGGRDRLAEVRLGRALVGAGLEAEGRRHCDRQQDPDDHDDDQELDQREALFIREPLPQLNHAVTPSLVEWDEDPENDCLPARGLTSPALPGRATSWKRYRIRGRRTTSSGPRGTRPQPAACRSGTASRWSRSQRAREPRLAPAEPQP